MSLLSDFSNAAFTTASAIIGTQTFSIGGGTAVAAVKGEVRHSKGFEDGGFAPGRSLTLVCNKSVFDAAYTAAANTYVGNTVVFENTTYRLSGIDVGQSHVTVGLEHEEGG